MKKIFYRKVETFLFVAVGILMFGLLLYLWLVPNVEITQTRDASGYVEVDSVDYSERMENGGLVRQFRFTLDEQIAYDTTLIFRYHHQSADVYLDGELVYSLHPSEKLGIVRTPGGHWAMIPLFREDVGKEVLVELRPVYSDYQDQKMYFYVGSKLSVYTDQLLSSLPEMLLCLADIFSGLILMVIALYFAAKKQKTGVLYAMAALDISIGLWNFTQTNFALLILPEKNVFLFYVSLCMLTISVFALCKSVRENPDPRINRVRQWWLLGYGIVVVVQLALQLLGVFDLRQGLSFIHCALLITAVNMVLGNLMEWWRVSKGLEEKRKVSFVWVFGIGILLDLGNYYSDKGSGKLLFVLLAIFVYVLLEGGRLVSAYIRQRQTLEEMQTQLTMSRITTMMSQIRSHFVFNILNAISGMCKYDPEKADETVVRFSRYLRSNIDIMEDDKNVPFLQEMERLEDYVVLEQIRFGDRIEFTTDIEVEQFAIPPLILQPIVENAIKHGISKRKEGGKITLATQDTGKYIVITVADNGIGFPMEALDKKTSVGLRNIRFRLKHLVGGTMDIKSQLGIGTTVTLTIPKEKAYESDLH